MNVTLYDECRSLQLPHNEKSVLLALAARAGRGMREAYPSVATLARDTGMGTTMTRESLGSLKENGWIVAMGHVRGGRGNSVRYVLCPQKANGCALPFQEQKPTDSETKPNGIDPESQHTGVDEGIKGEKRGKDAPLPADSNHDGEALLLECWNDYLRILGKDNQFVRGKKNADHLRALIPHLEKMVPGRPDAVRELFQIAMEEMAQDGWITGKDGKGKHDFPSIVFNWDRVKEFLDKGNGVTVDD